MTRPTSLTMRAAMAAVLLLTIGAACADRRHVSVRALRPPSEEVRGRIQGALAVRTGYEEAPLLIDEPWRKSRSVGKGALTGAAVPVWFGLEMTAYSGGGDYGVFTGLGLLLAPVGAVAGAIAGPIVAMPDAEVKTYRDKIEASFAGIDPAPPIERGFSERARSSARVSTIIGNATPAPHMELTVMAYGLRAGGGVNPPMQPFIVLRGRLIDAEQEILHELLWAEGGKTRLFKEWSEADAAEIRAEFARLESRLAEEAEEEMLELVLIP